MKTRTFLSYGLCLMLAVSFFPQTALAMPFSGGTNYATGASPRHVVLGDWNKDGKLDAATTGYGDDSIAVFANDGLGNLTNYLNDTTCSNPDGIATADFNSDTWPDLVVACAGADRVTVFLNRANGTGSFIHGTESAAGVEPRGIATGDFDADGVQDVALASFGGGTDVLLGRDDGTFQAPVHYATGNYSLDVTVDDFDGNGRPDLAVANSCAGCFFPYGTGNVSYLSGNGDGTFAAAVNYSTTKGAVAIVSGDWNDDGKKDVAVAKHDNSAINQVGVLMGDGHGAFDPIVNYATDMRPEGIAAGDVNQDGIADLLATNSGDDDFSVMTGVGDGTFNAYATTTAGDAPMGVALGDLNRDGKLDVALTNMNDDTLEIFFDASPPTITSLSPNSSTVSNSGLTITITGSGFAPNDVGRVNGSDRPTSNITPTSMTVGIGANDLQQNGTLNFTVYNPALGLTSNASGFTVTGQTSGGGGGLPPDALLPPAVPDGGFAIHLNGDASKTTDRSVRVTFNAVTAGRQPEAKSFAISNTADFAGASILPLPVSGMDWDLCAKAGGAIIPAVCDQGERTVYAKFYSVWGRPSPVVSAKILYGSAGSITSAPVPETTAPAAPKQYAFGRNLRQGSIGTDVRDLQTFLNAQGFTVAVTGSGSSGNETTFFGPATFDALKRFQTAHADRILNPLGLTLPTGFFGSGTRGFINNL